MSTATEQDVLNDLLMVKDKIVTSWDDILFNQGILKTEMQDAITWFLNSDNLTTIENDIKNIKLTFPTAEEIKEIFHKAEAQASTELDKILVKIPIPGTPPAVEDLIDIIEAAKDWITTETQIGESDFDLIVSMVKAISDPDFSVALKPLDPSKANHSKSSGAPTPDFFLELAIALQDYFKTNQTNISSDVDALANNFHSLIQNIDVPDISSEIDALCTTLLHDESITTQEIFTQVQTLLSQDFGSAFSKLIASFSDDMGKCIQKAFQLLHDIVSTPLPVGDLLDLIKTITHSKITNPTLLDVITLLLAIPVTLAGGGKIKTTTPPPKSDEANAISEAIKDTPNDPSHPTPLSSDLKEILGYLKIYKGIFEMPLQVLFTDSYAVNGGPKGNDEKQKAKVFGGILAVANLIELMAVPLLTFPYQSPEKGNNTNQWLSWLGLYSTSIYGFPGTCYGLKKEFGTPANPQTALSMFQLRYFAEALVISSAVEAELKPDLGVATISAEEGAFLGSFGRLCTYFGNVILSKYNYYNKNKNPDGNGPFPDTAELLSLTLPKSTSDSNPTTFSKGALYSAHILGSSLKFANGIVLVKATNQ